MPLELHDDFWGVDFVLRGGSKCNPDFLGGSKNNGFWEVHGGWIIVVKIPLDRCHWRCMMISEVSISGVQFLHLVTRAAVSRTAARAHTERLWVTRSCTSGGIGRQGTVFLLSFHLAAWTNQDFWKLYFWVPIICVDAQERQLNARRVRKVSRIVSEAPGPYDYLTYLLIYNELGNC